MVNCTVIIAPTKNPAIAVVDMLCKVTFQICSQMLSKLHGVVKPVTTTSLTKIKHAPMSSIMSVSSFSTERLFEKVLNQWFFGFFELRGRALIDDLSLIQH